MVFYEVVMLLTKLKRFGPLLFALFVLLSLILSIGVQQASANPLVDTPDSVNTQSSNLGYAYHASTALKSDVLDHQLYNYLLDCFQDNGMDSVPASEVKSWEWLHGTFDRSSWRGSMYQSSSASCGDGNYIKEAFGRFGFDDAVVAFCSLSFTYTETNGGNGKPGTGGTTSCESGVAANQVSDGADGNNESATQLSAVKALLAKSPKAVAASHALAPSAEYIRYFETLMNGCNIKLFGKYDTSKKYDANTIFKIPVVSQDGDKVSNDLFVGTSGTGYTKSDTVALVASTTEQGGYTSITCGKLEQGLPKLADAYVAYLKQHPSDPGDKVNTQTDGSTSTDDDCVIQDNSALKWIICPLLSIGDNTIGLFQGYIMNFLFTPTHELFNSIQPSTDTFRNFGLGLIVIAGLIMVISQAMGFELFDAYTIKRTMPRLLVAAIGIALAMPLLEFIISLFNDLGVLIGNIIINSVGPPANSGKYFSADLKSVLGGIGSGLTVAGATGGIAVGTFLAAGASFGGALALMGTIILSLLIGLFVLAIRQMVILMCVLLAPLAIASYVLPGTQKIWKFWKDALITSLVMFPLIMGFIAAGTAMSVVLGNTGQTEMGFLALIVRFAPYFLLPFAFKLAGGLMSTIFSIANDKSRGLFDRSKNYRAGQRKLFADDLASKRGRLGDSAIGRGYRRATTRGAGGLSRSADGRRKWQASEKAVTARAAEEGLKNDNNRAFLDDDATTAAIHATSRDDFVRRFTARTGRSEAEAREAMGALETGMGGRSAIGTGVMKAAAYKARTASTKGYTADDAGFKEMYADGASLASAGIIGDGDMAQAIKANKGRPDYGAGYGDIFEAIAEAKKNGGAIKDTTVKKLRRSAVKGMRPGELLSGHPDAVTAVAPVMVDEFIEIFNGSGPDGTPGSGTPGSGDPVAIDQYLASLAGKYDVMSQVAPANAEIMAKGVMGRSITMADGSETTIRQLMDTRKDNPNYQNMRKDYGASEMKARAANADPTQPPLPNL